MRGPRGSFSRPAPWHWPWGCKEQDLHGMGWPIWGMLKLQKVKEQLLLRKKKKKKSYSGFIKIPGTRIPTPAFQNKVKDWSFKLLLAAEIFPLNRLYRTGIENKSEWSYLAEWKGHCLQPQLLDFLSLPPEGRLDEHGLKFEIWHSAARSPDLSLVSTFDYRNYINKWFLLNLPLNLIQNNSWFLIRSDMSHWVLLVLTLLECKTSIKK